MGRRQKETRRLQGMRASVRVGTQPRVQAERKGDQPRVRSCGVWKGELSVSGEQSQDENLGTEH